MTTRLLFAPVFLLLTACDWAVASSPGSAPNAGPVTLPGTRPGPGPDCSGVIAVAPFQNCPNTAPTTKPECKPAMPYSGRPLRAPLGVHLAVSSSTDRPLSDMRRDRLNSALKSFSTAVGARAISAAVTLTDEGTWSGSDLPNGATTLWWASVGKLFTATVVYQLAQEGKLSLADPVTRWVRDVPSGESITVGQLLSHTSGLASASDDPEVNRRQERLQLSQALMVIRRRGSLFCPGTNWRYSNTGYDILGAIIEEVDRRPLAEAISARILRPLEMASARALAADDRLAGLAPPWSAKGNTTSPIVAGAAGPIVAEARDMVRFWQAFLAGRVLRFDTIAGMTSILYPMFDAGTWYGQGIMVIDVPDDRRTVWLGHLGGAPGTSAALVWSPADRAIVAVALSGDGSASAVANGLLKEIRALRAEPDQ